ncbi:Somatostatin receptor type 5 [Lamellibrachia satsuma]|nr:Somatostatin receptor type 5 [Lamellibrachia satsuma]
MNESLNISNTLLNDTIILPRTETNIPIASSSAKVVYILLGSIGIIGNLLVVVAVVSVKSRAKHYADMLIVNQSAIDLLSSVFIIATTLTADTSNRKLSGFVDELYCRFWISGYINWSLFLSSTYNLVLLTLERYMAIVHPIRHHTWLTWGKTYAAMAVVWCIGPVYNMMHRVPTSGLSDGMCFKFHFWPSRLMARVFGVIAILVQFFIPLAILIYAYVLMTVRLRTKVHPIGPTPAASTAGTSATATDGHQVDAGRRAKSIKERASKSIFKTMVTVTVCFVICWIFNQVLFLLFNFGHHVDFQSSFYHFTVYIAFANSCVNPIIYTFQYNVFRHGLRELFCGRRDSAADSSVYQMTTA